MMEPSSSTEAIIKDLLEAQIALLTSVTQYVNLRRNSTNLSFLLSKDVPVFTSYLSAYNSIVESPQEPEQCQPRNTPGHVLPRSPARQLKDLYWPSHLHKLILSLFHWQTICNIKLCTMFILSTCKDKTHI